MDRQALILGQAIERSIESSKRFSMGCIVAGSRGTGTITLGMQCHGVFLVARAAAGASATLAAHELGDGVEPRSEASAIVDLIEFAVGTDEGLLARVLGIGQACRVLAADRQRDGAMAIDQPREGLAVASPMGIEVSAVLVHRVAHGRSLGAVRVERHEFTRNLALYWCDNR